MRRDTVLLYTLYLVSSFQIDKKNKSQKKNTSRINARHDAETGEEGLKHAIHFRCCGGL